MSVWVTGRKRRQPTSGAYGYAHQQARAAWAPRVRSGQVLCGVCDRVICPGKAWDLDHVLPVSLGGRDGPTYPAHRRCNRAKGGINRLRRLRVSAA